MENRKYEFTEETKEIDGHILHRIKAVRSFDDIIEGELGGFIENELNLSHDNDCWVYDGACVYENSRVKGDACIFDNARVFGCATICDNAIIGDDTSVSGNARIYDYVRVVGNAIVCDSPSIFNNVCISHNACVKGNSLIFGKAVIADNARVGGNVYIDDNVYIGGDAVVNGIEDYVYIRNFFSSGRHITYTRSNGMWRTGCFYGTGEELVRKAYQDSDKKGKQFEIIVKSIKDVYNVE